MRRPPFLLTVVLAALALFTLPASAQDWRINITRAPSGNIIATLNGQTPSCQAVAPTAFVTQSGSTFVVRSQTSSTCTQPGLPLFPFTSVADLGVLSEGTYDVSWSLAFLDSPVGIPITTTFAINGNSSIAQVLCDTTRLSGNGYLYFQPSAPSTAEYVSVFAGRYAYYQPVATVQMVGTSIRVDLTATYRGIAGADECAVITLGPLPAGTYTMSLYLQERGSSVPPSLQTTTSLTVVQGTETVAKLQRVSGDRQIVVGVNTTHGPYTVRAVSEAGIPVSGVPVVIGYSTYFQPGPLLADEFGFRGFNVTGEDYVYNNGFGPIPNVFGFTNAEGLVTIPAASGQFTPSAGPVGAVVIGQYFHNVTSVPQVFFHEVRLLNAPPGKPSVVVEFFNREVGHYFVTLLQDEIDKLDAGAFAGWSRSIGAFLAYEKAEDAPSGAVPVCRFVSSKFTSHFYTASASECDHVAAALKEDWTLETRTAFYILEPEKATGACPPNHQPIYRMFNRTLSPNHRYITDRKLRDRMTGAGWIAEGYGPEGVMMCTPM